jgi:hypothetical protein
MNVLRLSTVHMLLAGLALSAACSSNATTSSTSNSASGGVPTSSASGTGGSSSDSSSSTAGGGDPSGAGGAGGAGGGMVATPKCGDKQAAPGELCFGPRVDLTVASTDIRDVILMDCDADKHLDIVAVSHDKKHVIALPNLKGMNGEAALNFKAEQLSSVDGNPLGLLQVQVDGLEGLDLVVAAGGTAAVSGLYPMSAGGVACKWNQLERVKLISGQPVDRGIVALDLDQSGPPDIAAITSADKLAYWLNKTGGTADEKGVTGSQLSAIASGEVTGDKYADVVLTDAGGERLWVYPAEFPSFKAPIMVPTVGKLPVNNPTALAIADFDGDKLNDIVVLFASAKLLFIKNQNNASYVVGPVFDTFKTNAKITKPASGATSLAAADMDNDGDTDLVVLHGTENPAYAASVSVLLNRFKDVKNVNDTKNDPAFEVAATTNLGKILVQEDFPLAAPKLGSKVTIGDLNGDGAKDIVMVQYANSGSSLVSYFLAAP